MRRWNSPREESRVCESCFPRSPALPRHLRPLFGSCLTTIGRRRGELRLGRKTPSRKQFLSAPVRTCVEPVCCERELFCLNSVLKFLSAGAAAVRARRRASRQIRAASRRMMHAPSCPRPSSTYLAQTKSRGAPESGSRGASTSDGADDDATRAAIDELLSDPARRNVVHSYSLHAATEVEGGLKLHLVLKFRYDEALIEEYFGATKPSKAVEKRYGDAHRLFPYCIIQLNRGDQHLVDVPEQGWQGLRADRALRDGDQRDVQPLPPAHP